MSNKPTPTDLAAYVAHCLNAAPGKMSISRMRDVVIGTKRPNAKHSAEVTLAVADSIVKAVKGPVEKGSGGPRDRHPARRLRRLRRSEEAPG